MSRSSTPGYLTPQSEHNWNKSCNQINQDELASLIASKLASRQSSRQSSRRATPCRTPQPYSSSLPVVQEEPHNRHRPPPLYIPPPHQQQVMPQTPPRGWRTPEHRKNVIVPYRPQPGPVVRMAYTTGDQASFLEAPVRQGSSFSFKNGQSEFQIQY